MSLTVYDVRLGNPEITACNPACLRDDREVLTDCDKRVSVTAQSILYALQKLSGSIPGAILEPETFSISTAAGAGVGVITGAVLGTRLKNANPYADYCRDWYYWAMTWAAQKPKARAIMTCLNLAGVAGNAAASIFYQTKACAVVNGAMLGFTAGYNLGRFGVEAKHQRRQETDAQELVVNPELVTNDLNADLEQL